MQFSSVTRPTSSEERPLAPVHRQQDAGAEADALGKVDAAPQVHGQQAAAEAEAVDVEDGGVADVGQAAEVAVLEGLGHGVVDVAVADVVGRHARAGARQLVELARQVLALLVRALRRGRQARQLGVDLVQQLVELAEVERAALVLVVLGEQPVQPPQVVRRLREALLDLLRHVPPLRERDVQRRGVLALLVRQAAQEVHDVVGHVVLHRGAVANGVHGAERRAVDTQVCVRLERMPVGLRRDLASDLFAEVCLRNTSGPQAEAHRQLFFDCFAFLPLLREYNPIWSDLLDP